MKRKNMTRNALITSIISILLCVSMLVGATFAWFTDEVVTGMNTIAAGNLDIELYANGAKVESATPLFDDVELWEPGVVTYENLEIKNVGTLALKYQMTLNFKDNNDLNGHKLSEVVKVAILEEKIADGATREEVLAKAQAVVEKDNGNGNLANFYDGGSLLPGATTGEKTVVIFWAPNANEIDNLYNANNGQQTSDGKPLSIEFGINLQATQLMHEFDSFGNDYDKDAGILPQAAVNGLPAQTISTTWGMGGAAEEIEVPFIMQFQPNETYEEAQASQYGKWHADFVVKADRDVAADSMALGGYYKVFCDGYNGKNWVSLTSDKAITAGTQIRLVEGMGNGAIVVNYEEICQFGNDGTGFLCTAKDLTGANAGTTLTVELRLYEVEKPSAANGNSWNVETGKYVVVGTYSYTFPAKKAATVAELNAALKDGGEVQLAGNVMVAATETGSNGYGATGISVSGSILNGNGNKLGVNKWGTWDSAINITSGTIKNLTVNSGMRGIFINHNGAAGKVYLENVIIDGTIYTISCDQGTNNGLEAKNCTFNGWTSYAKTIGDVKFVDCSFGAGQGYNFSRPYAPTEYVGCNFAAGHQIDAVAAVTFENCTFNGEPLTAANLATLVTGNTANATIK